MPFRPLFDIQQSHGRAELRSLQRSHLVAESMKLPYCVNNTVLFHLQNKKV
jgi:hypothetical protein